MCGEDATIEIATQGLPLQPVGQIIKIAADTWERRGTGPSNKGGVTEKPPGDAALSSHSQPLPKIIKNYLAWPSRSKSIGGYLDFGTALSGAVSLLANHRFKFIEQFFDITTFRNWFYGDIVAIYNQNFSMFGLQP